MPKTETKKVEDEIHMPKINDLGYVRFGLLMPASMYRDLIRASRLKFRTDDITQTIRMFIQSGIIQTVPAELRE